MRFLACTDTTLLLSIPGCATALTTANVKAYASRADAVSQELTFTITPPTAQGAVALELNVPPNLARGVWQFNVQTPCGCYQLSAYVNGCVAPALPGTHHATSGPPEACIPLLQADLLATTPVIGVRFARSADNTHTGVDLAADPIYGSLLDPHPALTTLELTALVDGLALVGSLAPLPLALDGRPWALLDAHGRELASGTLAVNAGAGTLSAPLAFPLSCGIHYLRIETANG